MGILINLKQGNKTHGLWGPRIGSQDPHKTHDEKDDWLAKKLQKK
jgi:hypothetical protein